MSRIPLVVRFLSVLVLSLLAHEALAGTTVVAGTCRPTLPSYATISAALAAIPSPTTVLICPQTFNEQVQITQPVSLQGISSANSAQPVLAPPSGGLTQTTLSSSSQAVAYQLWVNNVSGSVNLSNITIDGVGNGLSSCAPFLAGIFYQNSSGTVNQVTTRNQKGNGCGQGVWLEGGGSSPSVTVENSTVYGFDRIGIYSETNSGPSALTATIKGNDVNVSVGDGIFLDGGATDTVTGNFVSGGSFGIFTQTSAAGSVSGNTVMNSSNGIGAFADVVSVTSNKIMFSGTAGIVIGATSVSVQANRITSGPIGLELNCMANHNVRSNSIIDAGTGVDAVPAGLTTANTYINVATIKTGC